MHRLIIAVAAVFLITSSASAQGSKEVKLKYMSDDIIMDGKILQTLEGWLYVEYKGRIFSCRIHYHNSVRCYLPKVYNAVMDK